MEDATFPESSVDRIIIDRKAGKQNLVFILGERSLKA
jgi:hypothetical protein